VVKLGWWLVKDWKALLLTDDYFVVWHMEWQGKHVYYRMIFSDGIHYLFLIQDEPEQRKYVHITIKDEVEFTNKLESGKMPIREMVFDAGLAQILETYWSDIQLLNN